MKFTRTELAGSFGDLGTLLPLAAGMIMINKLEPTGIFYVVGLFYIFSGLYFRLTCPVEPMKVISAYAIATGISATQIQASCFWVCIMLGLIGVTGLINHIGQFVQKPVIRGVQFSTGLLLISQGVKLITGASPLQILQHSAEPYLSLQNISFLPIGILLGSCVGFITLLLLDNKRFPAGAVVVGIGLTVGLIFGTHEGWSEVKIGLYLPQLLPYSLPSMQDVGFALLVLTLPQIPMTIGNAVIANADLSAQYFPDKSSRVTHRALCVSMALANGASYLFGGMPLCHGAGGLASRFRFGARTAGSNIMIGTLFLLTALLLGDGILAVIHLLPMSVLGVLLVFAGAQLSLTILDMKTRKEVFIVIVIVGITLAANLAAGFITGVFLFYLLKWKKLSI